MKILKSSTYNFLLKRIDILRNQNFVLQKQLEKAERVNGYLNKENHDLNIHNRWLLRVIEDEKEV